MTIWVKEINGGWYHAFAISDEYHDAVDYLADTIEQAVQMFEKDRHVHVNKVINL